MGIRMQITTTPMIVLKKSPPVVWLLSSSPIQTLLSVTESHCVNRLIAGHGL